jgi:hypothetical protein
MSCILLNFSDVMVKYLRFNRPGGQWLAKLLKKRRYIGGNIAIMHEIG